jgi:hypothetical protein
VVPFSSAAVGNFHSALDRKPLKRDRQRLLPRERITPLSGFEVQRTNKLGLQPPAGQSKDETVSGRLTRSKTKVKGINFGGYASLVKQANDSARQAIVGVRIHNKTNDENPVTQMAGLFWDAAPDGSNR